MKRLGVLLTAAAAATATLVAFAPGASARPAAPQTAQLPAHSWSKTLGTTTVTTAPGIATTLLRAGIVPLPQRETSLGLSLRRGLQVSYGFPITGSTREPVHGDR